MGYGIGFLEIIANRADNRLLRMGNPFALAA